MRAAAPSSTRWNDPAAPAARRRAAAARLARRRGVMAAIACIAVFGVCAGMTHPLFALRLEAMGYSSAMIGLNGAMVAVAALGAGAGHARHHRGGSACPPS
jgi:hypothetical protein